MARKLTFTINDRVCHPNYSGDISFTTSRVSEERCFRTVLDTELVFTDGFGDFSWIVSQDFDTEFKVKIESDNGFIWKGVFYKTDCVFSDDDRKVTVKPETDDLYKRLLEKMDDTVDIVKAGMRSVSVSMAKRGILQLYIVTNGTVCDSIVTNWLGNMTWEQNANAPTQTSESGIRDYLTTRCAFENMGGPAGIRVNVLGVGSEANGVYVGGRIGNSLGTWTFSRGDGYTVEVRHTTTGISGSPYQTSVNIKNAQGQTIRGSSQSGTSYPDPSVVISGVVYTYYDYYLRWLSDNETTGGSRRLSEDIVEYTLNYRFVKPYNTTSEHLDIVFSNATSDTPTQYGKDMFGKYFVKPSYSREHPVFPVARSTWSPYSIWLETSAELEQDAEALISMVELKDAYLLPDVISTLLHELVPEEIDGVTIHHAFSTEYSSRLYNEDFGQPPLIVPNSNVKKTYYSNPAQKGEMTLRQLLDMVRDCFNCYWFIDDEGRFRIEFIESFRNGGLADSHVEDMEVKIAPRNLKLWTYGQNEWSFDKHELPERVEWQYSERQTDPFNGMVLEYRSNYVRRGIVDKVIISNFCADLDYIMTLPSSITDDGWTLILPTGTGAVTDSYEVVPQAVTIDGYTYHILNHRATRFSLFMEYGRDDMAAPRFVFANSEFYTAESLKRVKVQKVVFPRETTFSPYSMAWSHLGLGEFTEIVYEPLSDLMRATLHLDTE